MNLTTLKAQDLYYVRILDLSCYVEGKELTGGGYRYVTSYTRINDGSFRVRHGTSSEFDYCTRYGTFRRCEDCAYLDHENDQCTAEFETATQAEVQKQIDACDGDTLQITESSPR